MTQTKRAGRGSDQFPLRLPDGMRDAIKAAADISGRSMNAEIVDRLETSLGNTKSEDAEKQFNRQIRVLLDTQARMKDHFKEAMDALVRGDAATALHVLAPLAWYEPSLADDSDNGEA